MPKGTGTVQAYSVTAVGGELQKKFKGLTASHKCGYGPPEVEHLLDGRTVWVPAHKLADFEKLYTRMSRDRGN